MIIGLSSIDTSVLVSATTITKTNRYTAMQVKDGTIKAVSPAGHQIRTANGTIYYTATNQRGVPIEVGHGVQMVFPHRKYGLSSWVRTTEPGVGELVICQIHHNTPEGEIDTWCTSNERRALSRAIQAHEPWSFGPEDVDLDNLTTTHIWVAFLRHLMIRRRLQEAPAIRAVLSEVRTSVGDHILVPTAPSHNQDFSPQRLIDWLIEACHLDKPTATAWQQAVARM
jgi:hypothetical protein